MPRKVLNCVASAWLNSCSVAEASFRSQPLKRFHIASRNRDGEGIVGPLADAVSAMRSKQFFPSNTVVNATLVFVGDIRVQQWARMYKNAFACVAPPTADTRSWSPVSGEGGVSVSLRTRTLVWNVPKSTAVDPALLNVAIRELKEVGIEVVLTAICETPDEGLHKYVDRVARLK